MTQYKIHNFRTTRFLTSNDELIIDANRAHRLNILYTYIHV